MESDTILHTHTNHYSGSCLLKENLGRKNIINIYCIFLVLGKIKNDLQLTHLIMQSNGMSLTSLANAN